MFQISLVSLQMSVHWVDITVIRGVSILMDPTHAPVTVGLYLIPMVKHVCLTNRGMMTIQLLTFLYLTL